MKDFYTDHSLKILYILAEKNENLRDFIKTSSDKLSEEEKISELPSTAFADPINRLFPIHTKEMAKLSYYYGSYQKDKIPGEILTKIANALELFGEEIPIIDSSSLPRESTNYLLPKEELYPANNSQEVKLAVAYFDDYGYQLSTNKRREFCKNLVKTASTFKVSADDLSPYIKRYAGITGTDLRKLAMELDNRIFICEENNKPKIYKEAYEKIGKELSNFEGPIVYNHPRQFEKIALAIEEIDKEAGLTNSYAHVINDPFTSVFNTEKLAERSLHIDGQTVPYSKLYKLSKEDLSDALGPDFVNEVYEDNHVNIEKLASIIPTLPLDMKRGLLYFVRNQ